MHARPAAIVLALCVAALAGPALVSAQATPPGTALLAGMERAMNAAGSARATISSAPSGASGGMRERISGSLAVSSRSRLTHLVMRTTVTTTGAHPVSVTGRFESIAVGAKLAQRENAMRWGCQAMTPAQQASAYGYTLELPQQPLSITTLGAGTIHGVAVWRVQIVPDPKRTNLGPATLFIARDSSRLVRESLLFGTKGSTPGPVTLLLDYGRYGEPVKVALPAACGA